jgi:hypothetical protein
VRVDDAGGGAFENARLGADGRFAAFGFILGDEVCRNANGGGELVHFLDGVHLHVILRYDPFASVAVWNGVLLA